MQCVAKPMRPVKQRQRTQPEEDELCQRISKYSQHVCVVGGPTQPAGNAMPNSSKSDGINIADSTPPAPNNSHKYGSLCCLTTYAPSTSQATTRDAATQAA